MAYQSKTEQRAQLSRDYSGGESTLNSKDVTMSKSTGNNGPSRLIGSAFSKDNSQRLYGQTVKRSMSSGVAGPMKGDGFPSGPRQQRVSDDSTRKGGNTTRINPDTGITHAKMKTTGSTPKALRGGR